MSYLKLSFWCLQISQKTNERAVWDNSPLVVNFCFWKLKWLLCGGFSVEHMKIFHLEYLTAMCAWIDNLYISGNYGIGKMNYKSNRYFLAVQNSTYQYVKYIDLLFSANFWWYASEKRKLFHTVPSLQFNGEKAAAYNRDFFSLIGP